MKKLLAAMALISLVACGSSGPYTQARSEGDYGYLENRITENRYRVSFRGNAGTTSDQVKDMALLRAAELTLLNNYDWFRVVSSRPTNSRLAPWLAPPYLKRPRPIAPAARSAVPPPSCRPSRP